MNRSAFTGLCEVYSAIRSVNNPLLFRSRLTKTHFKIKNLIVENHFLCR